MEPFDAVERPSTAAGHNPPKSHHALQEPQTGSPDPAESRCAACVTVWRPATGGAAEALRDLLAKVQR